MPDFRKLMTDAHVRLLAQLYRLPDQTGRLPNDWVADQIARLDRIDGDIDQLTQRIAHVRTWSYIAHRADWVADPGHWQARAQEIEDRLSEALHAGADPALRRPPARGAAPAPARRAAKWWPRSTPPTR